MMTAEQILQKYGGTQSGAMPSSGTQGQVGTPGSMNSSQILQKYGGQASPPPANEKDSKWQMALNTAADLALGAAKGAGSTISTIGSFGERALAGTIGRGVEAITGKPRINAAQADQTINAALTPTNTAQKVGYGLEQVGEFFVPGGAVARGAKAIEGAATLSKLGSLGKAGAKLFPQLAADVAVSGVQSKGDIKTMSEAGAFSLGGGVLGGLAAKGLKNFGNLLFLRTMPVTPKQLANDLKKGIDIGEALSKTGVSFTKGQLLGKVLTKVNTLTNRVDDLVGAAGTNMSRSFDEIANDTYKLLKDKELGASLEASPINMESVKQVASETIEKYRQLYAGKMLTPAQQHQLKQDIGVGLGRAWDKMLSTPIRAEAFTESKIYGALNGFLRKNIDGYEALNKELAPLREGLKRAGEKGQYSGYLTDVIAASLAGSTGANIFEDPVGFMKNAVTGVLLKRGLTSTASKTIGGTIAKQLSNVLDRPEFFQLLRSITGSVGQKDQQTNPQ